MNERDVVVLVRDLPEYGLQTGDTGVIVLVHGNDEAYEVEFVTLAGQTIAVVTLEANQIRPIQKREIAHARSLETI